MQKGSKVQEQTEAIAGSKAEQASGLLYRLRGEGDTNREGRNNDWFRNTDPENSSRCLIMQEAREYGY